MNRYFNKSHHFKNKFKSRNHHKRPKRKKRCKDNAWIAFQNQNRSENKIHKIGKISSKDTNTNASEDDEDDDEPVNYDLWKQKFTKQPDSDYEEQDSNNNNCSCNGMECADACVHKSKTKGNTTIMSDNFDSSIVTPQMDGALSSSVMDHRSGSSHKKCNKTTADLNDFHNFEINKEYHFQTAQSVFLKWCNQFELTKTAITDISDLFDGVLLFRILAIVSPQYFNEKTITIPFKTNKLTHNQRIFNLDQLKFCLTNFMEEKVCKESTELVRKIDFNIFAVAKANWDDNLRKEFMEIIELVLFCSFEAENFKEAKVNLAYLELKDEGLLQSIIKIKDKLTKRMNRFGTTPKRMKDMDLYNNNNNNKWHHKHAHTRHKHHNHWRYNKRGGGKGQYRADNRQKRQYHHKNQNNNNGHINYKNNNKKSYYTRHKRGGGNAYARFNNNNRMSRSRSRSRERGKRYNGQRHFLTNKRYQEYKSGENKPHYFTKQWLEDDLDIKQKYMMYHFTNDGGSVNEPTPQYVRDMEGVTIFDGTVTPNF